MKKLAIVVLAVVLSTMFTATAFAGTISDKDALNIALSDAGFGKSQVADIEIEKKKSVIEVEFEKKNGKVGYEYKLSANGGAIMKKEIEYAYKCNCSKSKVGKKAVRRKVAKLSGIDYSIVKKAKCTYKYKNHKGKYKISFRYEGVDHEFEVLAPTGKVIEWEMKFAA